jgi:dynein heavy chain
LDESIKDAESINPIFFILSPGADPVKFVEKIAKVEGLERGKSFFDIALGQGQDEIARRRIDEGNREGHWVML